MLGRSRNANNVSISIIVALGVGAIFNRYFYWVFCLSLLILLIIKRSGSIVYRKMPGQVPYFLFLFLGTFIGFVNIINNAQPIWPFLRDIIIATRMTIFWCIGIMFGMKYQYDKEVLYRSVFVYGFIYSLIQIATRLFGYLGSNEQGFSAFVISGAVDEFALAIALFISFFRPDRIRGYYISRRFDMIARLVIMTSVILAFSRTLILILLCLIITMGFRKLKPLLKLSLIGVALLIIVSYSVPSVVTFFVDKLERSLTEISSNRISWTEHDIVWNWRGYERYCAVEQFKDFDFCAKIFGKGFGQSIDAMGYAYLVTGEEGLASLHNGYYTSLIKGGVFGVALYILYFFETAILFHHKHLTVYERRFVLGIIISMAVSAYFIGGVFWGGESLLVYMLLGWISVGENRIENQLLYRYT